jgi:hypothetical protein
MTQLAIALRLVRASFLLAAASTGSVAMAQTSFSVLLGGEEAVPPVPTPASGSAAVDLDLATRVITVAGAYAGLTSPAVVVDLHGPAPFGQTGPSLMNLTHVPGGTFGGTGVLSPQQVADLALGLCYVDVHTTAFPSGEIRGQVLSPPKVAVYGSKLNPSGSLGVLLGKPMIGTTLVVGVDNPLATQGPGSLPFLALALLPDPGTPIPGFGMGGPLGELLLGLSTQFATVPGAPWLGPGSPAPVALPIPDNLSLVGLTVYAQGLLVDPAGSQTFGLTQGAAVTLAAASGCSVATFNPEDCTGSCSGTCLAGSFDCNWAFSLLQYAVDIALGSPCPGWGCVCP